MKFSVYKRPFIQLDGSVVYYHYIVIVDDNGIKHFTDFGRYIRPLNGENLIPNSFNGNNAYSYVRMFLEYIFVYTDTKSLREMTIDKVIEFFNLYHTCELPFDDDDVSRSAATQRRCRDVIMGFLKNLIKYSLVPFQESDMYRTTSKRISQGGRRGKIVKVKVPVFEIITSGKSTKSKVYRDIPDKAFKFLFSYIRQHHHDIFGLIVLSAFVGLRPAEACNVRRHDCTMYGPGIRFTFSRSKHPSHIEIDLTRELELRSDKKYVGGIKKERKQAVTEVFRDAFYIAYQEQLEYCEGRKREIEYGALNVNKQGKCFTYSNYYQRFTKIVKEELVPIFLRQEDDEIREYGAILQQHNLSPHVFRHWFTVQLVLAGVYTDTEIADARGDKSTESAQIYLRNKSELEKKYQKATDNIWDVLTKEAQLLFTK